MKTLGFEPETSRIRNNFFAYLCFFSELFIEDQYDAQNSTRIIIQDLVEKMTFIDGFRFYSRFSGNNYTEDYRRQPFRNKLIFEDIEK